MTEILCCFTGAIQREHTVLQEKNDTVVEETHVPC